MTHKEVPLFRVYVWERPVRIYHWINALCILVLCVTGYLIGNPVVLQHGGNDASNHYFFGWIRFIHFATAYLFLFNFLFRIYWGFVGNRYANWKNYFPYTKKHFQNMWDVLLVDVLQIRKKDIETPGHNAVANFMYFITFLAFLFEVITGFGMYSAMSDNWFSDLFRWVIPVFGGDLILRMIHHAVMWVFVVFTIVHVYLVFYHDYVDGSGVLSSMAGGWKFVSKEKFLRKNQKKAAEGK